MAVIMAVPFIVFARSASSQSCSASSLGTDSLARSAWRNSMVLSRASASIL